MNRIKSAVSNLFQIKAILFGISIFLVVYVPVLEQRSNRDFGCHDCGFEGRQVLLLLLASSTLLIKRNWSVIISLLASLKLVCTFGYLTFWNTELRIGSISHLSNWMVLQDSISWVYEWNSMWLIELFITLIISFYSIQFLWQSIFQKFLRNLKPNKQI